VENIFNPKERKTKMPENIFEQKIDSLWKKRINNEITPKQFIDLYRSVISEWNRETRRRKAEKQKVMSAVMLVTVIPALVGSGKLFD
jgi:hypothetical protein